eukprot:TRINITY_DN374_c0_g1_i3.p1 TRINITY_DN374_c0_g1~~TRINITY_DN374_c0_g1_i3.p1  ORF type:complete len:118 (-),score=5.55 TRINITY_DN374_c0_g1_i3:4-357(-)
MCIRDRFQQHKAVYKYVSNIVSPQTDYFNLYSKSLKFCDSSGLSDVQEALSSSYQAQRSLFDFCQTFQVVNSTLNKWRTQTQSNGTIMQPIRRRGPAKNTKLQILAFSAIGLSLIHI